MEYIVKETDLIGEIENFPIEVVQEMVNMQVRQGNFPNVEVFQISKSASSSAGGFQWKSDDYDFWYKVITLKRFNLFFDRYPKNNKSIIYDED